MSRPSVEDRIMVMLTAVALAVTVSVWARLIGLL